jgi:hypothetical protein
LKQENTTLPKSPVPQHMPLFVVMRNCRIRIVKMIDL